MPNKSTTEKQFCKMMAGRELSNQEFEAKQKRAEAQLKADQALYPARPDPTPWFDPTVSSEVRARQSAEFTAQVKRIRELREQVESLRAED